MKLMSMMKYYIIVILVMTSMALVVMGLIQTNVLWILFGCGMMFLSYYILKKLKKRYEIDYGQQYEKKYETKMKFHLKHFILAMIAVLILIVLWRGLSLTFSGSSYLDIQSAISEGCEKLEPKKLCRNDPSKIIVTFDVNKDGIVGGEGDTFSALMEAQNCTAQCIKVRCGCPQ